MSQKKRRSSSNELEVQNAAKTLYSNIRFMSPDDPITSIVMTSAVPNEGKSTCSYELCRAIATSGKKVLLVEADMRRRSLANLMNVRPPVGLYAVLSGQASLSEAVMQTPTTGLYFLDVEPSIPNPADIISSKRFHTLVSKLSGIYDYVVYDTPPVGTFVDAAILSTMVDGTVLVVKTGGTKRAELQNAYDQLQKAEANILGVCATFCEGTGSEYYYAYYTEDGRRMKSGGSNSPAVQSPHAGGSRYANAPAHR